MFNFFSDVKARLTVLEQKVEAIFTHIHTEFAAKVVADEADVKADVADVKADVAKDAGTVVADVVTKTEDAV
jgi:hypothetical protein